MKAARYLILPCQRNEWYKKNMKCLLAAMAFAVLCLMAEYPYKSMAGKAPSVFEVVFRYNGERIIGDGERGNSYSLMMAMREQTWFPVLFPLIVSFPFLGYFADEWQYGRYYLAASRIGKRAYGKRNAFLSAMYGALTVFSGALLYCGVIYLKFPSRKEYLLHGVNLSDGGASEFELALSLAAMILHLMIWGALFALMVQLLYLYLKDLFFSVTTPMAIMYLLNKLNGIYLTYLMEKYEFMDAPVKENIPMLFFPGMILCMERDFSYYFHLPYGIYFVAELLLLLYLWNAVVRKIEQREG